MNVKKIFVAGAGQMGNGIAQVAIQNGFDVLMYDIAEDFVQKGTRIIESNLDRKVKKGKLTARDKTDILAKLDTTVELAQAGDVDVVIEAIPENEDLKKKLFSELDQICEESTVFASNTSAISITKLSSVTRRPEKVIGMHFMYPVPVMRLIEMLLVQEIYF